MSEYQRFSDSDRRKHSSFWHAGNRITKLREAAKAICDELGTNDSDLRYRINIVLGEADAPVSKTVGRFFDGENLEYKPWAVTALCHAMFRLCQDNGEKLESRTEAVQQLEYLREETRIEFPGFPPPPRTINPGGPLVGREALQRTLDAIEAPKGEDNPRRPEFPPLSPRYPATPLVRIKVRGQPVWIKDESYNPTGSHKDRWAWEQLLLYKRVIQVKLDRESNKRQISIPSLCMISSGSAAYALQCLLRLKGLPPLHVVIDDDRAGPRVIETLKAVGAEVHPCDLDLLELDEDAVYTATGLSRSSGIDITTRKLATPEGERFYDWLVCEILRERPRDIYVPFGTGDLYANIVCFLEKEINAKFRDPRLTGITQKCLRGINVIGATTNDRQTRMDKLFAKYRPTFKAIQSKVDGLIDSGILGAQSAILEVSDNCAEDALNLAHENNIRAELSGIAALGLFMERHIVPGINKRRKVIIVNTGWMYTGP